LPPDPAPVDFRDAADPELFPPRRDAPGEFAIFAARAFDMPFFRRPSYCFSFFTLARLAGTGPPFSIRVTVPATLDPDGLALRPCPEGRG
jgi:hypothetical protein